MAAVIATLIGLLVLTALVHDNTRLFGSGEPRRPPPVRRRGRHAALEAAEPRLVGLRLHHRLGAAAYRQRMSSLAQGRRTPAPARPSAETWARAEAVYALPSPRSGPPTAAPC